MNKTRAKVIISSIAVFFTAILTIASSFAWFGKFDYVDIGFDDTGIGGGFITYFDSGSGSESNPFVITTAEHYANMINLQYEKEGWSDKNYYYQFGKKDSSGNVLGFYKVVDGEIKRDQYVNTLDLGGESYRPLGTCDNPFKQHINGNDLTVKNFIVDGEGQTDIGIFGYVNESGTCTNAYFDDFTIDAGDASIANSELENGHVPHDEHKHEKTSYIGYLAGHMLYAGNFTEVYVNDCKVIGKNANKNNLNDFSYYGMVDNYVTGGGYSTGTRYEYSLNAPSVYSYLNSRFDEFDDVPMRLRNSGYDNEDEINNAMFQTNDPSKPIYPLTNAIQSGGDWISYGYDLVGKGPNTTSVSHSYSLSTLGYFGAQYETNPHNGLIYYKNGNSYTQLGVHKLNETNVSLENSTNGTKDGVDSRYYDTDHWTYYKTYNYIDTTTHSISFTLPETITSNTFTPVLQNNTDNNATFTFYFYLDQDVNGAATKEITRTVTGKCIHNSLVNARVSATFKSTADRTFTFDGIPAGIHHYAAQCKLEVEQNNGNKRTRYFALTTRNNQTLSKNVVDLRTNNASFELSNNADNGDGYKVTAGDPFAPYVNKYHDNVGPYDLYLKEGETYNRLDYKNTTFTDEVSYKEDGSIDHVEWSGSYSTKDPIEGTAGEHYLAGTTDGETQQSIREENLKNEIYTSGYRYDNIDIVGGGVNFGPNYITFRCSRNNQLLSPKITSTDINTPFYATHYAPNSVVMYLKNVSGTKESDSLGNIEFHYGWSVLGSSVKDPIFRGANGAEDLFNLDNLKNETEYEDDYSYEIDQDDNTKRHVYLNIRRKAVKKAAYCALDKNGNILCGYDVNGNQIGNNAEIQDKNIDTYVLVFSIRAISSIFQINTRISSIKFSYNAVDGAGGDFGSVDYRSADDADNKVTDTILNYYIFADEDFDISYYVEVVYDGNKNYAITFKASDTENMLMNVFLIDDSYSVSVNGGGAFHGNSLGIRPTGGYEYSPPSG